MITAILRKHKKRTSSERNVVGNQIKRKVTYWKEEKSKKFENVQKRNITQ